jgi:hypothetical protein
MNGYGIPIVIGALILLWSAMALSVFCDRVFRALLESEE